MSPIQQCWSTERSLRILSASSLSGPSAPPVPDENFWGLVELGLARAGCPSCHQTIIVQALKGTRSTNHIWWPGLIFFYQQLVFWWKGHWRGLHVDACVDLICVTGCLGAGHWSLCWCYRVQTARLPGQSDTRLHCDACSWQGIQATRHWWVDSCHYS